jgi:hypothetical protein
MAEARKKLTRLVAGRTAQALHAGMPRISSQLLSGPFTKVGEEVDDFDVAFEKAWEIAECRRVGRGSLAREALREIESAEERAAEILKRSRGALLKLANALATRDEVDMGEVLEILDGK